jgi:hypothetical protein
MTAEKSPRRHGSPSYPEKLETDKCREHQGRAGSQLSQS